MTRRNVYESQIEEWLECYPEDLQRNGEAYILGRQVQLYHGRADLLIWNDQVLVVELKAGALKEQDVCQVLRYTYDVQRWIGEIAGPLCCRNEVYAHAKHQYDGEALEAFKAVLVKHLLFQVPDDGWPPVVPVLVGFSCSDNIYAAMQAARGEVYEWMGHNDGYSFKRYAHLRGQTLRMRDQPRPLWLERSARHILKLACDEANTCVVEAIVEKALGE